MTNKMAINSEKIENSKKLVNQLVELLGIDADVNVEADEDNDAIRIDIDTDEAGLLIGNRGRTINSLQIIIAQMINQGDEDWDRVLLDIADWREKEERRLQELAIQTAERARETGESQSLFNLNSAERRIVHMTLSEEDGIETKSEGEGKERYLLILPK